MTRINAKINPAYMPDKILGREINEILRPFNKAHKRAEAGTLSCKPTTMFKLGAGHESFFFDKIAFLHFRYTLLQNEWHKRFGAYFGSYTEYLGKFDDFKESYPEFYRIWNTSHAKACSANRIIVERILEKVDGYADSTFRYKREKITKSQFITLMQQSAEPV